MNCHYCGAELHDNEIFCRNCGTRRQEEEKSVPTVSAPEEPVAVAAVAEPYTPRPMEYKEKTFDWHPYGAPAAEEPLISLHSQAPALQLPVKRSLVKMIFLSIVTLGIYPMVIWSRLTGEVNLVASRYDGQRSMPFFGMVMLAPLTLGIHSLVWMNKLCYRIGSELQRRGIGYSFGAKDFWLWSFLLGGLGSICAGVCSVIAATGSDAYVVLWILIAVTLMTLIGPMVFTAKLMNAMNRLNEDYNLNG